MLYFISAIQESDLVKYFSSVQFSHSVVSDSLGPYGLQHTRPACPSPTPGVYFWIAAILTEHHSLKTSVLWDSPFFIVQLSHPYMTTGKTIALSRWTFVGKAMSLLFNTLSKLVIGSLPRSKCLNFMAAGILGRLFKRTDSWSIVFLSFPPTSCFLFRFTNLAS